MKAQKDNKPEMTDNSLASYFIEKACSDGQQESQPKQMKSGSKMFFEVLDYLAIEYINRGNDETFAKLLSKKLGRPVATDKASLAQAVAEDLERRWGHEHPRQFGSQRGWLIICRR